MSCSRYQPRFPPLHLVDVKLTRRFSPGTPIFSFIKIPACGRLEWFGLKGFFANETTKQRYSQESGSLPCAGSKSDVK